MPRNRADATAEDAPIFPDGVVTVPHARARNAPLIAALNDRWRVDDDALQWILRVRKGQPSARSSGWQGEHYCRQRTSLLRCIREYCGEVDPAPVAIIEALPDWHPDRDKSFRIIAAE